MKSRALARHWKDGDPRNKYFFLSLWMQADGDWFCTGEARKDGGGKTDSIIGAYWWRKPFHGVVEWIESRKAHKDLYWCVQGFRRSGADDDHREGEHDLFGRLADLCAPSLWHWDEVDNTGFADIPWQPHWAWVTSPALEGEPEHWHGLWRLDGPSSPELRSMISRMLNPRGQGGWKDTQWLRIPGSVNFKPGRNNSIIKVVRSWDGKSKYKIAQLERVLRKRGIVADQRQVTGLEGSNDRYADIWKRSQGKLSGELRRLLRQKHIGEHDDRSKVLWRLIRELLEQGITTGDSAALVWRTVWAESKYGKSEVGWRRLQKEIDRALEKINKGRVPPTPGVDLIDDEGSPNTDPEDMVVMDEVKERSIKWIWYPYIAEGEITLIEANPGASKSWVALKVGIEIANGTYELPSVLQGHRSSRAQPVCFWDAENARDTILKPRLRWLGYKNTGKLYVSDRIVQIDDEEDYASIRRTLDRIKPKLICFDPVTAYMGGVREASVSAVKEWYGKVLELARDYQAGVVLVRHLAKAAYGAAIHQGSGNMANAGSARIILRIERRESEDQEGTHVLLAVKQNMSSSDDFKSIPFTIRKAENRTPAKQKKNRNGRVLVDLDIQRAEFFWGTPVDKTADQFLQDLDSDKRSNRDAVVFLQGLLLRGGKDFRTEVMPAAEKRGFSEKSIRTAARRLGVQNVLKRDKDPRSRRSTWFLPGRE